MSDLHRIPYALHPAIALTTWFGLSGFQARVGYARSALHTAVDLGPWEGADVIAPWLLCLTVLGAMQWWRGNQPDRTRSTGLTNLVWLLIVVRVIGLWNPLGAVLPWLGVLWAPHADWALALTASCCLAGRPRTCRSWPSDRAITLGLFAALAVLYSAFALYHTQMTMLHGDEGHYLLVTQSLLHDGDVDLADDLDSATTDEFHTVPFGAHEAPSSPPGKVISIHPVGLSAALVPAYGLGLALWNNPRLGCALFLALLTAGCVACGYRFLRRLSFSQFTSLACAATAASTPPLALFSNQLYPDVPAALIAFVVLAVALPPGLRAARQAPASSPVALVVLTSLVALLPFLHLRLLTCCAAGGASGLEDVAEPLADALGYPVPTGAGCDRPDVL